MRTASTYRFVHLMGQKVLLLMGMMFCTQEASAQKGIIEAGIHTGTAMTRLYEQSKNRNDFYFQAVPDMGVQVSYGISNCFSLAAELNYVTIRTRREGLQPVENAFPQYNLPRAAYASFSDKIELNYLELPILISGQTGGHLKVCYGLGPFIGIRLGAMRTTSDGDLAYTVNTTNLVEAIQIPPTRLQGGEEDITANTRAINLGACERIGLGYKLGRSTIWIEARYSFGQMDIWKKGQGSDVNQTDLLVLRAAYTIQL